MLNRGQGLDAAFRALADPTRRAILDRLSRGPESVSALAEPFDITLPGVHQHLGILEAAGLTISEKKGRVRVCRVNARGLAAVEDWILHRRLSWERRLDTLGAHLTKRSDKQ